MKNILIIGGRGCGKAALIEALEKGSGNSVGIKLFTTGELAELFALRQKLDELPTFKISAVKRKESTIHVSYDHPSKRVGKGGRSQKRSNFKYQSKKR